MNERQWDVKPPSFDIDEGGSMADGYLDIDNGMTGS